jgi:hypothetical protein
MSDTFGAEIRLGGGQLARMNEGTVEIVSSSQPVENKKFYFRMTVTHKSDLGKTRPLYDTNGNLRRPTQVSCASYDSLIGFLKQLESLDYTLTNIERVVGELARP